MLLSDKRSNLQESYRPMVETVKIRRPHFRAQLFQRNHRLLFADSLFPTETLVLFVQIGQQVLCLGRCCFACPFQELQRATLLWHKGLQLLLRIGIPLHLF
jgi:hypothetical protein